MTYRVLVADDMDDVRVLLRHTLERSGRFSVVGEATNGAEAAAEAGATQPDLVLLDIAMPVVDGISALPAIRLAAPSAVVIVLSSFGRRRMQESALAAGASGFLEKGIDPDRLVTELLDALDGGSDTGQLATLQLAPDPRSAGSARRFVEKTLHGWGCSELVDTTVLLTSELVTNAVLHAQSSLELVLRLGSRFLRVEVHDRSRAAPAPRDAPPSSTGGRGLGMVDLLADSWGVAPAHHRAGGGKVVWFEMEAEADPEALS